MFIKQKIKTLTNVALLMAISLPSLATIVTFETSQGDIEVNLFDSTTPATVANFLNYVNAGSYNNTVIHRSIPKFIIQGGGFTFDGEKLVEIEANAAVENEPVYSNVAGTIAMAKIGGNANSATNQWFFNIDDNSNNLDFQNSGFTVFGQVISGMENLIVIESLTHCDEIPLADYTNENCLNGILPSAENFVTITNVDISDSSVDTAKELTPVLAKVLDNEEENNSSNSSSSGGALGWLGMFTLFFIMFRRALQGIYNK